MRSLNPLVRHKQRFVWCTARRWGWNAAKGFPRNRPDKNITLGGNGLTALQFIQHDYDHRSDKECLWNYTAINVKWGQDAMPELVVELQYDPPMVNLAGTFDKVCSHLLSALCGVATAHPLPGPGAEECCTPLASDVHADLPAPCGLLCVESRACARDSQYLPATVALFQGRCRGTACVHWQWAS
jgi:hypothetical protein